MKEMTLATRVARSRIEVPSRVRARIGREETSETGVKEDAEERKRERERGDALLCSARGRERERGLYF